MDKKIIVARIDELLQEKGISKYELKENTDISSTIYQWRKNAKRDKERTPSLKSIEKICNYLGVSLSYFFSFEKENQREIKSIEMSKRIMQLNNEQLKIIDLLLKQFDNS